MKAGQQLLHYRLTAKIGEGGMGVVWRATDRQLDREAAIKILPRALATDAERLTRFQREARVLASLNHSNIAGIYGIHETPEVGTFLAMELVEGEDLEQRLTRGAIPTDEALRIALQVAQALEAAHERGVIHRDLKPANVKVTPDGTVKVLDFGLAKAGSPEASMPPDQSPSMSPTLAPAATMAGTILGTAAYMSPEQASGRPVDRRTDIWAFGALLFEMLAGERLFRGETASESLAAVILGRIDLDRLPADTRPALRRLLERCLRRDPLWRLRDIGDVRIALQEIVDGDGGETIASSIDSPSGRIRAERLGWLAALAVAAGLGVWGWLGNATPDSPAADWRLSIARPEEATLDMFAISPDGSTVAITDGSGMQLRRLDRLETVRLPETERASFPFWSPDGRWVAFRQRSKLRRVSVSSGLMETIADTPNMRAPGVWIEGDRILFHPIYNGVLMVVDAAGGSDPQPVTSRSPGKERSGHQWPAMLPDGNRFLYSERDYERNTSNLRLGSLDSLESREILPPAPGVIQYTTIVDDHVIYLRENVLLAHPFDSKSGAITGEPEVLLSDVRVNRISVSPSGLLLWTEHRDEVAPRLTWLDRSGNALQSYADLPDPVGSPRLSRDGRYFLFDAQDRELDDLQTLFVYDIERERLRRELSINGFIGTWSPDGKRIAFIGERDLQILDAGSSASPQAVGVGGADTGSTTMPSDWSPDGRHIAYTRSNPAGERSIWIYPVERGEPFLYEDSSTDEREAVFSPDGKWIAHRSRRTGGHEVYINSFPVPGTPVQVSTNGGRNPRWRSDGKELFYAWIPDGSELAEFHAVDVERSAAGIRVGKSRLLFEVRALVWNQFYDVSEDGQRFLMPILPEPVPEPIHVLARWRLAMDAPSVPTSVRH